MWGDDSRAHVSELEGGPASLCEAPVEAGGGGERTQREEASAFPVSGSGGLWHFQSQVPKLRVTPQVGRKSMVTRGTVGRKGKEGEEA